MQPELALNVSLVLPTLPFLDRFAAAADGGWTAVEFWWPWDERRAGLSFGAVDAAVRRAGVRVVLLNMDGGDFSAGERGLAGVPGREVDFRHAAEEAFELAELVHCPSLNVLAGRVVAGGSAGSQRDLLVANLALAAELAGPGRQVLLEALNAADLPGYLVPDSGTALELLGRTGRDDVHFQLDAYHLATIGEPIPDVIRRASEKVGHVQLADYPGRHEPGTGHLDLRAIFAALGEIGYRRAIGCEYVASCPSAPDYSFLTYLLEAIAIAYGSAG